MRARAQIGVLRSLGVVGLVIGAVLLASGGVAAAKDASSIDDTGWWTRANQDALIGGALVFPDVSPGQLLVEGTPEGATAIAALRATLPKDTTRPVLTLTAASAAGADTAVLLACQAGSGWTGAHGGQWSAKPNPDCSQSVQGVPEGDEWTFALEALQFGDQLNVVFVPGVDPNSGGSANSTFRIVFDRPTEASIQVSESSVEPDFEVPDFDNGDFGSDSGDSAASAASGAGSTGGSGGSGFSGSSSPSFSAPSPASADQLADQPVQAALPADEQGQTATAPILSASNPLAPEPLPAANGGSDGRLLGLLVVLCAGALLYWSSQQELPARRTLSRFAVAAGGGAPVAADEGPVDIAETVPEEKRMGGLGRFRRARDTPARRLGT